MKKDSKGIEQRRKDLQILHLASKITHKNIPNFGNPNKPERRKKIDTMLSWIGATSIDDFEPEDRKNVLKAIIGEYPEQYKADDRSSVAAPFRQNYDYTGNFLERIKSRLKKKRRG